MTRSTACCENCRYSYELQQPQGVLSEIGSPKPMICRRYPKQTTIATGLAPDGIPGLVAGAAYPPTFPSEWCGEYATKIELKSA